MAGGFTGAALGAIGGPGGMVVGAKVDMAVGRYLGQKLGHLQPNAHSAIKPSFNNSAPAKHIWPGTDSHQCFKRIMMMPMKNFWENYKKNFSLLIKFMKKHWKALAIIYVLCGFAVYTVNFILSFYLIAPTILEIVILSLISLSSFLYSC
ncbi:hypothetical protein ACFPVS_01490 [Neisseria weixii]|uniref:hypothetical protein n=1 Tax=Neisseria weixii TaxID=1853276 RepID=UPI000BB91634|nr:hypothetical protein [Neisseria weixii]ATD64545.1 hypothetical protein CGZ65_03055 [Neisseria weixii]